jgi:hypothetical protein
MNRKISPIPRAGWIALAAAVEVAGVWAVASAQTGDAPPPGGKVIADPRCDPGLYAEGLQRDSENFGVPPVAVEVMQQPLTGGVEWTGDQVLRPGGPALETPHLRLSLGIEKVDPARSDRPGRVSHLVLSIANRLGLPIAYQVTTVPSHPERCAGMGHLPHNALALLPRETLRRTECLAAPDLTLKVTRIEVYELTELSHRYLSKVQPAEGGPFDLRVAEGHNSGGRYGCPKLADRTGSLAGEGGWRRLVDFYARHDCDRYPMPSSHQPAAGPVALPVCDAVAPAITIQPEPPPPPPPTPGHSRRLVLLIVVSVLSLGLIGYLLWAWNERRWQRELVQRSHYDAAVLAIDPKRQPDETVVDDRH